MSKSPEVVIGGSAYDDRGSLSFLNNFQSFTLKRFYFIENYQQGFVRAWHGHQKESKFFICVSGAFKLAAVKLSDPKNPDKNADLICQVLDSRQPRYFFVPAGYANGLMSLTENAKLLVLSDQFLEDAKDDDFRFPYDFWNPWYVEPR